MKQFRMEKTLRIVIEQFVSAFDGFRIRLCGDLINSFCSGLENTYDDNSVELPTALKNIPITCAIGD